MELIKFCASCLQFSINIILIKTMANSKVWQVFYTVICNGIELIKAMIRADLSINQIFRFDSFEKAQDKLKYIAGLFKLNHLKDSRDAIILDFYYYSLLFAQEHKFSPEKTSAFFSILKDCHFHCIQSSHLCLEDDFAYFKDLLLKHCVHRPPYSEKIFDFQEGQVITDYAVQTQVIKHKQRVNNLTLLCSYFRHYALYKYTFAKKIKLFFNCDEAETIKTLGSITELKLQSTSVTNLVEKELPINDDLQQQGNNANIAKDLFPSGTKLGQEAVRPVGSLTGLADNNLKGSTSLQERDENSTPSPSISANVVRSSKSLVAINNGDSTNATNSTNNNNNNNSSNPASEDPILAFNASDPAQRKELAAQYIKTLVQDSVLAKIEELKQSLLSKLDEAKPMLNNSVANNPSIAFNNNNANINSGASQGTTATVGGGTASAANPNPLNKK